MDGITAMKPYGWKPRANEYAGRQEQLVRIVSRRLARTEARRSVLEQESDESRAAIRREVDAMPEECRRACCGGLES